MAWKLIVETPQHVAYEDIDVGPPAPGQVRVRSVISGISHGTEMTSFLGTSPFVTRTFADRLFVPRRPGDPPFYPCRWLGYENVGVVEAVGEGVAGYAVGDRIWSTANHQTHVLLTPGRSEMVKLTRTRDEDAVFLMLTAIAYTAVLDADVKLGDTVAVFGGGVVGQLAAQLALLHGAGRVVLSEPLARRRELAEAAAAVRTVDPSATPAAEAIRQANDGRPPDVLIECSGHVAGLRDAVRAAPVGGTVVAAGFYAGPASALNLGEEFLHNRVTVLASMGVWDCPPRCPRWDRGRVLRASAGLLEDGRLSLKGLLTDRVPFAHAQRAYEMIRDEPEAHLKVALTY